MRSQVFTAQPLYARHRWVQWKNFGALTHRQNSSVVSTIRAALELGSLSEHASKMPSPFTDLLVLTSPGLLLTTCNAMIAQ
jgi:hypothetical protein